MFQEEVANLTAIHFRSHFDGYRDIIQARYPDAVKLQLPKKVETDNLVGGVYNAKVSEMPAYAVDIIDKAFAGNTDESLWLYQYQGHIAGVVSGSGEQSVNRLVKRHEQIAEMFVREHEFLHARESAFIDDPNDFSIREMGFAGAAFSGAELIGEEQNRQTWIAGFRIDLVWIVSESGPYQHA